MVQFKIFKKMNNRIQVERAKELSYDFFIVTFEPF